MPLSLLVSRQKACGTGAESGKQKVPMFGMPLFDTMFVAAKGQMRNRTHAICLRWGVGGILCDENQTVRRGIRRYLGYATLTAVISPACAQKQDQRKKPHSASDFGSSPTKKRKSKVL
jgi:hypothetical protein